MAKIGIACHELRYSGGMERYIIDLIKGFAKLGFDITCFGRKFDKSLPEYAKVTPVHLKTSWVPSKLQDQLFSSLLKQARKKLIPDH